MRYATVTDLADDIRRHLAREPVVARHPTLGYRAKCLIKRNGSRLAASAAVVDYVSRSSVRVLGSVSTKCPRDAGSQTHQPSDLRRSSAVLPFENLGDNNSPSYFADGVQDNILTDLGKVGDLKVISRSGVAPYRGKNRNMKQIGRDLSVANILEKRADFGRPRAGLTPSSSTPRRTPRSGRSNTTANWRTSSRSRAAPRRDDAAQLKATLSTAKGGDLEATHAGFASLRSLSSRPRRLPQWRCNDAARIGT